MELELELQRDIYNRGGFGEELALQRDIYNRDGFGEKLEWYVAGVAHFWYARWDMLS